VSEVAPLSPRHAVRIGRDPFGTCEADLKTIHHPSRRAALVALTGAAALPLVIRGAHAGETRDWDAIRAAARGRTVHWNAWAGDDATNRFIAWAGERVRARDGVSVVHVKLADTAEAVTRVLAEVTAGRTAGGSVDLVWINGPNLQTLKARGLLHGPLDGVLPNHAAVDRTAKRSNVVDFAQPVDGMAVPWRLARVAFVHDGARLPADRVPRTMAQMGAWAAANPGRLAHPTARNFLGATFLKQALMELAPDPALLDLPATDAVYAEAVRPLWAWYDALRPHLWRGGRDFPASETAVRQLMGDGEIDVMITFNPAEAAASIANGLLPPTVRVFGLAGGTIGNTSFVAIPSNAANREGAMVLADFLLSPEAQARMRDPKVLGALDVLAHDRLPPDARALFRPADGDPAMPSDEALGPVLLEPHGSWMTRLAADWERRVTGR
jgi:putative thiamine transport system substrate-binding protein